MIARVTAEHPHLRLVGRLIEVFNSGEGDALAELLAPDCEVVAVTSGHVVRGPEELAAGLARLHDAFPDFELTAVRMLACGDTVVVEWRDRGTNTGPHRGLEPTGLAFARAGCTVADVCGGRIVSLRDYADPGAVPRQLGLEP